MFGSPLVIDFSPMHFDERQYHPGSKQGMIEAVPFEKKNRKKLWRCFSTA